MKRNFDYLVAINDNSDNPGQKWVINESILASLTGCFRPAIKKFVETPLSKIQNYNAGGAIVIILNHCDSWRVFWAVLKYVGAFSRDVVPCGPLF